MKRRAGQTGVTAAYANVGRWVADCAWCDSAVCLSPFVASYVCEGCGQSVRVTWPSSETVDGIDWLLGMRPDLLNRNWYPSETLHDLFEENEAHGLINIDDKIDTEQEQF